VTVEYELVHLDEFVDELLHGERSCDVILPRIQSRHVLEETEQLEPRVCSHSLFHLCTFHRKLEGLQPESEVVMIS
jgi:hypothetical protein